MDALSKAFALAVPHEEALCIRDDVGFFQTVRNSLAKRAPGTARPAEELDRVRARLRVYVKKVLRKHCYPPDKQEAATKTP